jgi:hypothetical protein
VIKYDSGDQIPAFLLQSSHSERKLIKVRRHPAPPPVALFVSPKSVSTVVLSNAKRQARWRAKRNALAEQAITEHDTDREIVRKIVCAIGIERARVLVRSMDRMTKPPQRYSATLYDLLSAYAEERQGPRSRKRAAKAKGSK